VKRKFSVWPDWRTGCWEIVMWCEENKIVAIVQSNILSKAKADKALEEWQKRGDFCNAN
jgi:hypothetical protein